jgi:chorismate mutase
VENNNKTKTKIRWKTRKKKTWLTDFNLSHPFVIAGPCSAETEEQVLKIAHELKGSDVVF